MKVFIVSMLLLITSCFRSPVLSAAVDSNTDGLNFTTSLRKIDHGRVEKDNKLKKIAWYLLAIAFLCFIVVPKGGIGFTPAQIIIVILFFACLLSSAILFLIDFVMRHHLN
jgi:hypothetical protein